MTPPAEIHAGGQRVAALPPGDRGLAYGDGLFETMRGQAGTVPWWDAHWARLVSGAARLGLPLPEEALARDAATRLLDGGDAVFKLLVTRGTGMRGYAPPRDSTPTWIASTHPLPVQPADGLALRWCRLRLSQQPRLAGIKHCNRLEHVLARGEWPAPGEPGGDDWDDGLLMDIEGAVVGATAANLFVFADGGWRTPPVHRCGVAGICRGWLLHAAGAIEQPLSPADVEGADAVVLCNAVRGILPVARLQERAWPRHPATAALARRLGAVHPGLAWTRTWTTHPGES